MRRCLGAPGPALHVLARMVVSYVGGANLHHLNWGAAFPNFACGLLIGGLALCGFCWRSLGSCPVLQLWRLLRRAFFVVARSVVPNFLLFLRLGLCLSVSESLLGVLGRVLVMYFWWLFWCSCCLCTWDCTFRRVCAFLSCWGGLSCCRLRPW